MPAINSPPPHHGGEQGATSSGHSQDAFLFVLSVRQREKAGKPLGPFVAGGV